MMTLGIDCAPGTPRPDRYARIVFDKLKIEYNEPISKCFGAWTWEIDVESDKYTAIKPWLKEYMNELVHKGSIRGAQWDFTGEDEEYRRYFALVEEDANSPAAQYTKQFAENRGITVEEALKTPAVKARISFYELTGL